MWLKIDWIRERLPYISRAGLAKKLAKLERDGHIIVVRGKGRHYHKSWYSPSPQLLEDIGGMGLSGDKAKVYYNPGMAKEHLAASVVYAAIVKLLRTKDHEPVKRKGAKLMIDEFNGRVDDGVLLDYAKLAAGSGLTIYQVRRAVRWLIVQKMIEAKTGFGNKRLVRLPANAPVNPADLPSESFLHEPPEQDDPTECYPHE